MLRAIVTATVLLLLTSCNWPEPPLPAPNADRDPRLLGVWHAQGKDSLLSLSITPVEGKKYRVVLKGDSKTGFADSPMEFVGYHTDVEGIRIISLELKNEKLGSGKARRWVLLSYKFADDGTFSPLFLSRTVLPEAPAPADFLKVSGQELYARISGAAKNEYLRSVFFDKATERVVFERNAAPKP